MLKQVNEDLEGLLSQVQFLTGAPNAHAAGVDLNSCNPINALTLVHHPEKTGNRRFQLNFRILSVLLRRACEKRPGHRVFLSRLAATTVLIRGGLYTRFFECGQQETESKQESW